MNGIKEYLIHHDPERWVDIDTTKEEYLMITKHVVLCIIIGILAGIVVYAYLLA